MERHGDMETHVRIAHGSGTGRQGIGRERAGDAGAQWRMVAQAHTRIAAWPCGCLPWPKAA